MSLQHWSYVAMLAFCLAGTLPLVPAFGLRVFRQPRRLLLAILLAGSPFVLWDLYATDAGHWRFDPAQTLPWRVAGLPLEEIGFFVVIPLAAVLTYEAVRVVRPGDRGRTPPRPRREVR
jgi:lycopene cyclase domain-containing protein